jgi:hypothetical protein
LYRRVGLLVVNTSCSIPTNLQIFSSKLQLIFSE